MHKVLYVNHKAQQCGVYEFGKEIGLLLESSKKFKISYAECDSFAEFKSCYNSFKPDIVVYNFHPATMPWVWTTNKYLPHKTYSLPAIQVGTIHEVYQKAADIANNDMFDYHIAPDPTLLLKNPIVYKTGRLLPQKVAQADVVHAIPVFGSFGFATPNKGFEKIITLVQNEFDEAVINLNIPYAKFGDEGGENARNIAENCRKLIFKPNITLNIDHSYLEKDELITFLSASTVNIFLYEDAVDRGISSATDWALAAGRPMALSKSSLFRHLLNCNPSICIADSSLKTIMSNGTLPLEKLQSEFGIDVFLWDYERILTDIIAKGLRPTSQKKPWWLFYKKRIKKKLGRIEPQVTANNWVKDDDDHNYTGKVEKGAHYTAIATKNLKLNRILDNNARQLYKPAIEFFKYLPGLIAKKIPEANVQQAFVFDTAVTLAGLFETPRLLAVGAFEDTAAEALKLLQYDIDLIDPVFNYDIGTFITKPNVKEGLYDVIISTSVIEHVEEDEQFTKDIAYLLSKGGYAILTCDYHDKYKKGDPIPGSDYRFYTQNDLKNRLMGVIPNCVLVDTPDWDCENPDFHLLDTYTYTFATLVFKKQ